MTEEERDRLIDIQVQLGTLASRTGVSKIQDASNILAEVVDDSEVEELFGK